MRSSVSGLAQGRRRLLLGVLGAALTAACGEMTPLPGLAPPGTATPRAAPSPATSPVPAGAPAVGQPIATTVQISASPTVQAGLPLIVPGRSASPPASPFASPGASPSPFPVVLGRPGLIAVEHDGRIVLVDPEQQVPTRLLSPGPDSSAPRWSPDGRGIAIVSGLGPSAELRLVPSGGGPARRLTSNARPERGAAWSPSGDRLVYVLSRALGADGREDPAEPEEIWLLDVTSGNDRKLADGFDPSWSPDGRWIVYASNGQRDAHGPRANAVRVVGADGQNDRPVLDIAAVPADLLPAFRLPFRPATVRLRAPSWSPDGRQLAVSADGHTSLVLTFDERGQAIRPWAVAFEGGVGRARWSPDARHLAVESRPATGAHVVIVAEQGAQRERAIGGPDAGFQATGPTWAPDGRRLALIASSLPTRIGEPRRSTLRLFAPDGAALGDLLEAPGLRDPDWGRAP